MSWATKNQAYTLNTPLISQANPNLMQVNPTLAAGDVQISIDGGTFTNITTLAVVTPAGSRQVQVDFTAAEMNGDSIILQFVDAAGNEWADKVIEIQTTVTDFDSLNTIAPDNAGITANGVAIGNLNDFDPLNDTVANVTTVNTTTNNTDMRGTDSAALATDLATVDTNVDAILVDTGTTIPGLITGLNDITVTDILTTQMTEAYAADGVAPTLAQVLFLLAQNIGDFSITGTTITVKQLDGTTTAATYTLDDGTSPTSRTRTT